MKTKLARKTYRCNICDSLINKGERYARKVVTIGRRGDEWMENINGVPSIIQNWISYDVKYCNNCVDQEGGA